MSESRPYLRIRDWGKIFENNRTRGLVEPTWFRCSNRLDADQFLDVTDHADGAAHWGVWTALCMIASRSEIRGVLMRDGGDPHTAETLARQTRFSISLIEGALLRFSQMSLVESCEAPQTISPVKQESAPHVNGKAVSADDGFHVWWKRWSEVTSRAVREHKAHIEWTKHVVPLEDKKPFYECVKSYFASGEVQRGRVKNPDTWIREAAADGWSSRWPAPDPEKGDKVERNLRNLHG